MAEIIKSRRNGIKHEDIQIATKYSLRRQQKPNWKCLGPDGALGYWLKIFRASHD